jgi:hypothetical protein
VVGSIWADTPKKVLCNTVLVGVLTAILIIGDFLSGYIFIVLKAFLIRVETDRLVPSLVETLSGYRGNKIDAYAILHVFSG